MYGDDGRLQRRAVAATRSKPLTPQNLGTGPLPVNPRPADANRSTAWVERPAGAATADRGDRQGARRRGHHARGDQLTGDAVDVRIINRRINQMPKAIGRTARVLAVGMPYSVETFRITPVEDGLPTTTVTVDRSDLEAQVNRPDAGQAELGHASGSPAALPVAARATTSGGATSIRWSTGRCMPVPTCSFFGGNDGLPAAARPPSSAAACRSARACRSRRRSASRSSACSTTRATTENSSTLPPVRSESTLLLRRLGAEADPADRRLPVQAQPRHLRPRLGRHARAGVRRRQRRGAVEAGRAELGPRRRAQLGGAARLLQPVRLRLLRLRRGDRPRLALLGHRLVRASRRSSPPAAISPATGAARCRCSGSFANGWAVGAYVTKTDVTDGGVRRGQLRQGHAR